MIPREVRRRGSSSPLVVLSLVLLMLIGGFLWMRSPNPALFGSNCPKVEGAATAAKSQPPANSSVSPMGVIIPLYMRPGCYWDEVIQLKSQYPSVPFVAILNPQNGTGTYDSEYASWVDRLDHAGVLTLGYVNTAYGRADPERAQVNITDYADWYHVGGIFLDEMSNKPGLEGYYSSLTNYAHSKGVGYVLGDPGTSTLPSYVGTVDNLMIYEDKGLPSAGVIQANSVHGLRTQFSFVAYSIQSLPPQSYFDTVSRYVSWVWVSDTPHSFQALPSYLPQELAEIQST